MSDDRLFKDSDEFEQTYVGEERTEQPTEAPKTFVADLDVGMLTTPPFRGDEDGLKTEPIDQGALGETEMTKSPRLNDSTNADAG